MDKIINGFIVPLCSLPHILFVRHDFHRNLFKQYDIFGTLLVNRYEILYLFSIHVSWRVHVGENRSEISFDAGYCSLYFGTGLVRIGGGGPPLDGRIGCHTYVSLNSGLEARACWPLLEWTMSASGPLAVEASRKRRGGERGRDVCRYE